MREIKSGGGKTTFEIEIKIVEVEDGELKSAYLSTDFWKEHFFNKG